MQIFIPPGRPFTLETVISTSNGTKRRIIFSPASKDVIINQLHVRVPNN